MNDETLADGLYLCERLAPTHPGVAALLDRYRQQKYALEQVEWMYNETGDFVGSDFCPWCNSCEKHGHSTDCQRQLALGATP